MASEVTSSGEGSKSMDASLLGELQYYIDLAIIYAKLPIGDFFRLRQVCKEWNRLASDRRFLGESFRDPIPQPYFVVNTPEMKLHRLLTYEASSRRWNWTRLPPVSCEAVILGKDYGGTQIYDSKSASWTYTQSTTKEYCAKHGQSDPITCANCNGFLYIRAWEIDHYEKIIDVYGYNLRIDEWDRNFTLPDELRLGTYDIGAWQDRLFLLEMKLVLSSVTVWERSNPNSNDWTVFDRMPEDMYSWMLAVEEYDDLDEHGVIDMRTRFCGEYVLVYNCVSNEEVAERAVLYNLDRKTWEKVELPSPPRLLSLKTARAERDAFVEKRLRTFAEYFLKSRYPTVSFGVVNH